MRPVVLLVLGAVLIYVAVTGRAESVWLALVRGKAAPG